MIGRSDGQGFRYEEALKIKAPILLTRDHSCDGESKGVREAFSYKNMKEIKVYIFFAFFFYKSSMGVKLLTLLRYNGQSTHQPTNGHVWS